MKQNIESKSKFTLLWETDFNKDAKQFSEERIILSTNYIGTIYSHAKKMNFNLTTKINSK